MELFQDQAEALDRVRASFGRGCRRPMLQAPTGYGKTILAAHIAKAATRKGNRVNFVVPFVSLIDQTCERFEGYGIDPAAIAVQQADHWRVDASSPVQVCSRDTLSRRGVRLPGELTVIDEAHVNSQFLFDWMGQTEQKFLGLSATPWTKGLGKHHDDLVIGADLDTLIKAGRLSDFRVFAPSTPDMTGCKVRAGEYTDEAAREIMGDEKIVADMVSTWLEHGRGLPTLGFAVDRAHARQMMERFSREGVSVAYVDAFTPAEERGEIGRAFNARRIEMVWNVNCLVAGVDWDVRCEIIGRPTKSEIWHVQSIGRALRYAPGKEPALILDHAGNHLRLGMVTDIKHDYLDDGETRLIKPDEKDEAEALGKVCPDCKFLKPPKTPKCPVCGFLSQKQSKVKEGAGQLAEIGRSGKKVKTEAEKRNAKDSRDRKQLVYSGFIHIQQQRRYKSKWSVRQYKEYYGVWPRGLSEIPAPPPAEITSWVRARMIAYAKGKKSA